MLEAADTDKARLIAITTPEGYQTRRIINWRARSILIDTAVRTHSESEVVYLERQEMGIAIMGERELALGLMKYALRSLGPPENAHLVVQNVRVSGEGVSMSGTRMPQHAPRRNCAPSK